MMLSMTSSVYSQEQGQCFEPQADSTSIGYTSGKVIEEKGHELDNPFKTFTRNGTIPGCDCSYVSQILYYNNGIGFVLENLILNLFLISVSLFQAQTKCVIQDDGYSELEGQDCSKLKIDGIEAATSGVYPNVTIAYDLQLCNKNSDIDMMFNANATKESYLQFFRSYGDKAYFFNKTYDGKTDALAPGECVTEIGTLNLDTTYAWYYMKAQIQGPTNATGVFCYAFAANPIDVKYDYGLGECKVNVSALCFYTKTILASNQNSNPFLIPAMS